MDGDVDGDADRRRRELETLIEGIKSAEVLENRISLLNQLEDWLQPETVDLAFLVNNLIVFWDDSMCSGVSHCVLHKSLLQLAVKLLEVDTVNCLGQFLILGTKANSWCWKHRLWTAASVDGSEDGDHDTLFPEIIFLVSNISIKLLSILAKFISVDLVHTVGDFVSELLHLTRTSIAESKRVHGAAPVIHRAAPVILDEAIKLCRAYSEAIKSSHCKMSTSEEEKTVEDREQDVTSHVLKITTCTIQTLYEIGRHAASSGGSQVSLLNLSWKGVVSLLQLGKGAIQEKVNVGDIILTLVCLAIQSLRFAAEAWASALKEPLNTSEARRAFLPIKFFLINAVRICSAYPLEAMAIYKEIVRCVLIISSLGILFSKESQLRTASEALVELLEPSSFLLLQTILNSSEITSDSKSKLLQWLFKSEEEAGLAHMEEHSEITINSASFGDIFATDFDAEHRNRTLLPGQVTVLLHLLSTSSSLREEVLIQLSTKLQILLEVLTLEDVYSYVLGLQIPILHGSEQISVIAWQPFYAFLIQALKSFMLAAASSHVAWMEVETVLLQNFFNPHFLCLQIVTELWCFFVCHAETDTGIHVINKLFLLMKTIASTEQVLAPLSALRKFAGALCIILSYASSATVDQIYTSMLSDDKSSLSSVLYVALLMEGFPFDSFSDSTKLLAVRKLFISFAAYLESFSKDHEAIDFPVSSSSGIVGFPVHALASALRCCKLMDTNNIDGETVTTMSKFTISLINVYRNSAESAKDNLVKHISSLLDIILNMKHLCEFSEMEKLILELHSLFVDGTDNSNTILYQCKPSLASFMAILCHLNITEGEANSLCSAIWDLYHFLLRERHWAFIHLAITSFGYFAARTSFTQLWRFVPDDAALSYNTSTGMDTDESRFMSELKAFLEKEVALYSDIWSEEQISILVSEGIALKKLAKTSCVVSQVSGSEKVVISEECVVKTKKRKIPEGICEGMALLQTGLKAMRSALHETDSAELNDEFSMHICRLEDVVSQLASLSGGM